MKFYKDQCGPILDKENYYQALRQLLFAAPDGFCAPEHSSECTEQEIRTRLLALGPDDLIPAVHIAATLDRSDPLFAEQWFLRLTSGCEARSKINEMAASCDHCKEEWQVLRDPDSPQNRKFGYHSKHEGNWLDGHKPDGSGDHDLRFNELAKRVRVAGLVKPG